MATAAALTPFVQFVKPETSTKSPNYLGIGFAPTDPNDGTDVWRLTGGNLETYQGQISQQDNGPVTSEWIWVDYPSVIAANGCEYSPLALLLTHSNPPLRHNFVCDL
jgi:hypothetical protein